MVLPRSPYPLRSRSLQQEPNCKNSGNSNSNSNSNGNGNGNGIGNGNGNTDVVGTTLQMTTSFRTLLDNETNVLSALCESWEQKMMLLLPPEEECDDTTKTKTSAALLVPATMLDSDDAAAAAAAAHLRATIGSARMLLGEKGKMKQFEQLLIDAETNAKTGKEEDKKLSIGEDDLQGFWDLLNFQIIDIQEKFKLLDHDHDQNEPSSSSSSSQQTPATAVGNDNKNPPKKKNSQSSKSNGNSSSTKNTSTNKKPRNITTTAHRPCPPTKSSKSNNSRPNIRDFIAQQRANKAKQENGIATTTTTTTK